MSQELLAPVTGAAEIAEQADITARQHALQRILDRSAIDRTFRARTLSEPAAVVAEYGISVPEGATITFIERSADLMLVLPEQIEEVSELTEEELMSINGGGSAGYSAWLSMKSGTSTTVASMVVTAVVSASIVTIAYTLLD